jgi:hypothetical protein
MNRAADSIRGTLQRVFSIGVGIALVLMGVSGWNPSGTVVAPWRRAAVILGGIFFLYCGCLYYLPSSRRKRAELKKLLDELETDLDTRDTKRQ